jgi:23S rRNA (guanine745-N1)-methyltransferase
LADEPGFELIDAHRIRYKLRLSGGQAVADLLLMTPYFWSVGPQDRDRLARLEALDTEVDVLVHAYRCTSELGAIV